MANLNLDDNSAQYQIRAYQAGMVQVNDVTYHHSLIITPQHIYPDWPVNTIEDLSIEVFSQFISLKPTILLIGTGTEHVFIPLEKYGHLLNAGIGVEIMSTAAACRTYNALSAENRLVAAGLIV